MADDAERMDNMYRLQRHFYDLTRKYYLLGRDAAIQRSMPRPEEYVLEVGCGTARNLSKLLSLQPGAHYFGLDASQEMLKTAGKKLSQVPHGDQVVLKTCLAENLDSHRTFGLDRPFDVILFSYALSMIPDWKSALAAARRNLAPSGRIIIVDFWDQRDLPRWFSRTLIWWLDMFGVHHRPELIAHLRELPEHEAIRVQIDPVWRSYAFIATLDKTRQSSICGPQPAAALGLA